MLTFESVCDCNIMAHIEILKPQYDDVVIAKLREILGEYACINSYKMDFVDPVSGAEYHEGTNVMIIDTSNNPQFWNMCLYLSALKSTGIILFKDHLQVDMPKGYEQYMIRGVEEDSLEIFDGVVVPIKMVVFANMAFYVDFDDIVHQMLRVGVAPPNDA